MYMFQEAFRPHLITLIVELTSSRRLVFVRAEATCKVRKPCCWKLLKKSISKVFRICNYLIKNASSTGETASERSGFVANNMSQRLKL